MAAGDEQNDTASKRVSSSGPSSTKSKRTSTALPKAPTSLDKTALIANHAVLTGLQPITVGARTVVHPHAKIDSTYVEIEIGAGCLIAERAHIGLTDAARDAEAETGQRPNKICIGNHVTIESGSVVEATSIGNNTLIDVAATVGAGAVIGKFCHISARESVAPGDDVPDCTVVYMNGQRRLNKSLQKTDIITTIKDKGHEQHLKLLERLIPSNAAKYQ